MSKDSKQLVFMLLVCVVIGYYSCSRKPSCESLGITPLPSYLYDTDAYREHLLKNEIEDVNERNGDSFDIQAARMRIAAMSDDEVDSERRKELAFASKVHEKAMQGCSGGKKLIENFSTTR
jgi:hypothetical protein